KGDAGEIDICWIEDPHTFFTQITLDEEAVAIGAEAGHQLRNEAQPRYADGEIERRTARKIFDFAGRKLDRIDDGVADTQHGRHEFIADWCGDGASLCAHPASGVPGRV